MSLANAIVWFEIPANDFERAVRFYETVLQVTLKRETFGPDGAIHMGLFPAECPAVTGAVVAGAGYEPGRSGAIVYLNGGEDLAVPLSRVAAAGGEVLVPKTLITPEIGYFAQFLDTEGNRVAFHSRA